MLKLYKNYYNQIFIENDNHKLLETMLVSDEIKPETATVNLNKHAACVEYDGKVYNTGLESKDVLKYFALIW